MYEGLDMSLGSHIHGFRLGLGMGLSFTEQELVLVLLQELRGSVLVQEQRVDPLDIINTHFSTLQDRRRKKEGNYCINVMYLTLLVLTGLHTCTCTSLSSRTYRLLIYTHIPFSFDRSSLQL